MPVPVRSTKIAEGCPKPREQSFVRAVSSRLWEMRARFAVPTGFKATPDANPRTR